MNFNTQKGLKRKTLQTFSAVKTDLDGRYEAHSFIFTFVTCRGTIPILFNIFPTVFISSASY